MPSRIVAYLLAFALLIAPLRVGSGCTHASACCAPASATQIDAPSDEMPACPLCETGEDEDAPAPGDPTDSDRPCENGRCCCAADRVLFAPAFIAGTRFSRDVMFARLVDSHAETRSLRPTTPPPRGGAGRAC